MCTSIISNGSKTIIGFNLGTLNMEYRVRAEEGKVYIVAQDDQEGRPSLSGANSRRDFVVMPTCWPFDERSNPANADSLDIINLDIDLLLRKKTLDEIKAVVEYEAVLSVPGVTFQSQLSDRFGNVLQITPGQGIWYASKPRYSVLTNFSPFKGNTERHPWMGLDRHYKAVELLENKSEDFDISDCFEVLKQTTQTIYPTVVSMVLDPVANTVYWCENREWDKTEKEKIAQQENDVVITTMIALAEVSEAKLIPYEAGGMIKYIIRYLACGFLFVSHVCDIQSLVS